MKIGVISDTHSFPIPPQVLQDLKRVDLIIHTGDFCDTKDLDTFKKIKDVKAVYGNMDSPALRKALPERLIFKVDDVTIGLFHGEGPAPQVFTRVQKIFEKQDVDVVIFGHSHQPLNERVGKILYFNPGSPTDTIHAPYRSYGLLEIDGREVKGRIIKIKE